MEVSFFHSSFILTIHDIIIEQMEAIHIASTPAELYNAVLVDTPLGITLFDLYLHQNFLL